MQEIILVFGILGGIFANLALLIGIFMAYSRGNYGHVIGGLVFLAGSMIVWTLPSVYFVTYSRKIDADNITTFKFCKWINGIFLIIGGLFILQIALRKL